MIPTFCLALLAGVVLSQGDIPMLHCVGCDNVTCPTEPTNCVLDRVPCGCCNVCSLGLHEACFGFSASCGPGLVCRTPAGTYDERPPWFSLFHGVCVWNSASPTLAPTIPHAIPTLDPSFGVGRKRK